MTNDEAKAVCAGQPQGAIAPRNDGARMYRAAIYFAVATMYFYRDEIEPLTMGQTHGAFAERNAAVIRQVCAEALEYLNYELSHQQIGMAIAAYLCDSVPLP